MSNIFSQTPGLKVSKFNDLSDNLLGMHTLFAGFLFLRGGSLRQLSKSTKEWISTGPEKSRQATVSKRKNHNLRASSAWLEAKTSWCKELPCASMVTTAGNFSTSNSQIASGEPNFSRK